MKFTAEDKEGSVLLTALLTITILTMICATSLYVASQNANSGMKTASWQQALTAAESAADQAMNALNMNAAGTSGAWTNWKTVTSGSLPTTQPSGGSTPAGPPTSGQYNYLIPSAITLNGEGNTSLSSWVTIDTNAVMVTTINGNSYPWYRIRATGVANAPLIARVSANKLDDNLRNTLGLRFNRKTGAAITGTGTNVSQVTRSIELVGQPVFPPVVSGGTGFTMMGSIKLSGAERLDSFNSSSGLYSTNGVYVQAKSESNANIGTQDSTGSNFNGAPVYGNVTYSGPALKGAVAGGNVHGTVSTPYNGSITQISDPSGSFTTLNNVTGLISAGNGSTSYYKYNGDFTMNSGQTLTIHPTGNGGTVVLWVTGNVNLNAQSNIIVQNGVKFILYGDNDINFAGDSFNNQNTYATNLVSPASMLNIYGVTPAGGPPSGSKTNKMNISDNASNPTQTFVGVINAPAYYINIKSAFSFSGAMIGNSTQVSSPAGLHYDEALNTGGAPGAVTVANYAYASWFEDNSDPTHNYRDQNGNLHPYIY